MGRAKGDGQATLPLATRATPLRPFEIVPNGVNVHQCGEQIAGQDHVFDHLSDLPVADHVGVGRTEREVLQRCLSTIHVAGIDAQLDVPDHVLERGLTAFDGRVRHAHDGRIAIARCPCVAGDALSHLGRRLTRVEPADQDAVLDQVGASCWRSLVVVLVGATEARERPVVKYGEDILSKSSPQDHHLLRFGIFIDKV